MVSNMTISKNFLRSMHYFFFAGTITRYCPRFAKTPTFGHAGMQLMVRTLSCLFRTRILLLGPIVLWPTEDGFEDTSGKFSCPVRIISESIIGTIGKHFEKTLDESAAFTSAGNTRIRKYPYTNRLGRCP